MRRALAYAFAVTASLLAVACGDDGTRIDLTYQLGTVNPADVARIETIIHVDPQDGRSFFADQPYRSIALGVGYEVRDLDGDGEREVVLLHEASLGFVFTSQFTFRLLPPANGAPPPLVLRAKAYGSATALGEATSTPATFGTTGKATLAIASTLCGKVSCQANQTCCGDVCVDTQKDASHCGDCGTTCGANADACAGGVCRCAGGAACGPGQRCCPGVGCVDDQSDRFNCGGCGNVCNPGEACVGGACKCGSGASCGDDGLCCVVDNVGTCSTTGSCQCGGSVVCTSPSVCCNAAAGQCANLMNDNANCGQCGKQCPVGLTCQSGSCRCAGQICASGDACCSDGCKTLKNDPSNCGQCGKTCRAGEACDNGVCTCGGNAMCSASESCCGSTCANTKTDARNCGQCGHECRPGETCTDGTCKCNGGNACAAGRTCCPSNGSAGSGGCVDLSSDRRNCKECGKSCNLNEACEGGQCVPTTCTPACTNGNQCVQGVCRCVGTGMACTGNLLCCGNAGCVDTTADPLNCGACGNPCPVQAPLCCNSQCIANDQLCGASTSCGDVICPKDQICCEACPGSGVKGTCADACPDLICPQGF